MTAITRFLDHAPPAMDWLLHTTIGGSLLILAVFAVRSGFGKRLPAVVLYTAGWVLLARLAVPLTLESGLSVYTPSPQPSTSLATLPVPETVPPGDPIEIRDPGPQPRESSASNFRPLEAIAPAEGVPSRDSETIASFRRPSLPTLLQGIWLSGVALFLLVGTTRYLRLRRWALCQAEGRDPALRNLLEECRARLQLRRLPRLRLVGQLRSAAVFGIVRPELLLPRTLVASLSPAELRHVVLHELAHLRRHDPITGIVAHLILAVHWFNPLAWIAVRHLTADREVLCDATVLRCLGQSERRSYGETLLRVLRLAPPPHPTGTALIPFHSNKPEIKRRLTMIAKSKTTRSLPGAFGTAAALAALSLTLAAAPAQDREREVEKDKPEARERVGDREKEKPEVREGEKERDKPEAREAEKREGEARKPEVREGERTEMMRAREKEIRAVREEIGRLAREGKREEAERLEVQLREKLERFRAEASPRPNVDLGKEPSIEALRAEIGRLSREGKHDQAERLEKRLRAKLEGARVEGRVTDRVVDRPAEVRPGNPDDVRRQLTELTELVRQMQRSMNEMREELHDLRGEKKAEE